ncbi:ComF family protein [Paenibacillus harenae]|uniref:ComF family protein n=2 Tax=Paenibacillus harenae TaxID=306543 RepID=A0ABT9UA70_PAEHA|nr:ComF family protein [Paenibacillus harenae]
MNITSILAWLRRLSSSLAEQAEWLSARSDICAFCRKPIQFDNSEATSGLKLPLQLRQQLCNPCLSTIPWLTRILCPRCGRGIHCDDCIRQPNRSFICNRSAVQYDQTMKSWLALYKYRGNEELAPLLGAMLQPAFEELSLSLGATMKRGSIAACWDAITYVPVSSARAEERGFNQAEQLASYLASRYHLPLLPLLSRERHTGKQSFKSRSERISDMKKLFRAELSSISKLEQIYGSVADTFSRTHARIILVDDIYTTGSTAEACAEELIASSSVPLEVFVLTWARS